MLVCSTRTAIFCLFWTVYRKSLLLALPALNATAVTHPTSAARLRPRSHGHQPSEANIQSASQSLAGAIAALFLASLCVVYFLFPSFSVADSNWARSPALSPFYFAADPHCSRPELTRSKGPVADCPDSLTSTIRPEHGHELQRPTDTAC